MSVYITPYKAGSQSAKLLAQKMQCLLLRKEGSKFVGNKEKLVINWGDSHPSEEVIKSSVLNPPEMVETCSNKLSFFRRLGHIDILPEWTESVGEATLWTEQGAQVVCRGLLQAHSGKGITLVSKDDLIPGVPLYTKYVPKKSEYRVHVFMGKAFDIQRKARRMDVPDDQVNWKIRNSEGGFIYARYDDLGDVPQKVLTNAETCASMVGLDFGAVDVIYNEKNDAAYVLEINTAPGLEGSTSVAYAERLTRFHELFKEVVRKGGDEEQYMQNTRDMVKVFQQEPILAAPILPRVEQQGHDDIIRNFQEHIRALEEQQQRIRRRGGHWPEFIVDRAG